MVYRGDGMPMSPEPSRLSLTPTVRAALAELLVTSLSLHDGDRVVDFIGMSPWGDLSAYRREVHEPLHGALAIAGDAAGKFKVEIPATDLAAVRRVLDGLAESVSGGVPWVALTSDERSAATRLIEQLKVDR